MAFIRVEGSTRKNFHNPVAKKASTAMNVGDALITTAGQMDVAVAGSALIYGLAVKKIASTDTDFASTTAIEVEKIDLEAEYIANVGTGTATVADIGEEHDLTDADSVDMTASVTKIVRITGVIDSTHVIVKFNPNFVV